MISLIYAVSENRIIGNNGKIPWHLPNDFKHFKSTTLLNSIVMGRKTFLLTGFLPRRKNYVLTKDKSIQLRDARVNVISGLELLMKLFKDSLNKLFVIGGVSLLQDAFAYCDDIYLTVVHAYVGGDTILTQFDFSGFTLESSLFHKKDLKHNHAFSIRHWKKVK